MKLKRINIRDNLMVNLLLLTGWIALTVYLFCNHYFSFGIVSLLVSLFFFYRTYSLMLKNNEKILLMLKAMENNDHNIRFPEYGENSTQDQEINKVINRVIRILGETRNNAIQQEKYYELILNSINIGIVVTNHNGYIFQKNNEALRLLGLPVLTHIKQLGKINEEGVELFSKARPGERFRLSYSNEREMIHLAVNVSGITLQNTPLRIFAFNNIHKELDSQELESWSKITRVLTHEIMNSVAPIISLSETLLNFPDREKQQLKEGLETIHSTGKGLLSFIQSYRKYTNIPTPIPVLINLEEFIGRMVNLAKHQYPSPDTIYRTQVKPADLILYADENLIAQVFINILKNASQAIGNRQNGEIEVLATIDPEETITITISNNGPIIPDEVAGNIFVPFFTTKSNGSGVGLSISRHIMKLSGGNLSLKTDKRKNLTTFILTFN